MLFLGGNRDCLQKMFITSTTVSSLLLNYAPLHYFEWKCLLPVKLFSVETVEGSELRLERLTRADMGAYLCIASNRIPSPVSKRIMIHVHCKLSLTT